MVESGLAIDGVAVVLRGHFNAAIVSPEWLFRQGLISREDADEAEIEIISPQLTRFSLPWLSCNATPDHLAFESASEPDFERLRDLTVGVLRTLSHTPVAALGINRQAHFPVDTMAQWHHIGDFLSPKDFWSDILELPGMKSTTVWGVRPDKYSGRIQVQVEPSVQVPIGIYVAYNDHHNLIEVTSRPESRDDFSLTDDAANATATQEKAAVAITILQEEWGASMSRSNRIIAKLVTLAKDRK